MSIQSLTRRFTLVSLIALSAVPSASAFPWSSPKHAKTKLVHLQIRNDEEQLISIRAGAQHFSIASHETVKAALAEGDDIILDTDTPKSRAGFHVITVVPQLADVTIAVK